MNTDPTRYEMLDLLSSVEADEIDIEGAIYWFAANHHDGQGSNLYNALSTSEFRPGWSINGPKPDSCEEFCYNELVAAFVK